MIKLMDDGKSSGQTLAQRREGLYQIFDRAAQKLLDEDISQEAFRTFNEAYKTACEKIERNIVADAQEQQLIEQHITAQYMQDLMFIHQEDSLAYGESLHKVELVLQQALDDLASDRISQESFSVFIEVYNTIKEGLKRRLPLQDSTKG